jgi:hypothetical protein
MADAAPLSTRTPPTRTAPGPISALPDTSRTVPVSAIASSAQNRAASLSPTAKWPISFSGTAIATSLSPSRATTTTGAPASLGLFSHFTGP